MAGQREPVAPEVPPIRPYERPYRATPKARGKPLRPAPYQAPGRVRFFLHVAVVGLIGAGVLATTLLSQAVPGAASTTVLDEPAASPEAATAQTLAAGSTQTSAEGQALDAPLNAPQPPADNLLLAVLALEASTTSAEVEASMERILGLGVPQDALPLASLKATAPEAGEEPSGGAAATNVEGEADDEAEDEVPSACADTGSAAYCVYTVVEGDTLSGISEDLGFAGNVTLSAAEMLAQSNKPDVISSDHIEPGQNIRVPRETGIVHTVLFLESAGEIAADYGVSLESILDSPYNGVGGDGVVVIGQEIFVPDPAQLPVNEEVELTLEAPTAEEATEPAPVATDEPTATPEPTLTPETLQLPDVPPLGALDTPTPEPTATPEATLEATPEVAEDEEPAPVVRTPNGESFFIWPAVGPISSYFGPSHPLGIDIDLFDNPSAEIIAARGGTVVFAGGDPCCSYGYYVIVEHENGVQTVYAHLSEILVSEGQEVAQGQVLGFGGQTGYATGNHLHFEMRVNGNVVDPLKYLP